jgi:hypothetical protein
MFMTSFGNTGMNKDITGRFMFTSSKKRQQHWKVTLRVVFHLLLHSIEEIRPVMAYEDFQIGESCGLAARQRWDCADRISYRKIVTKWHCGCNLLSTSKNGGKNGRISLQFFRSLPLLL